MMGHLDPGRGRMSFPICTYLPTKGVQRLTLRGIASQMRSRDLSADQGLSTLTLEVRDRVQLFRRATDPSPLDLALDAERMVLARPAHQCLTRRRESSCVPPL